MWLKLARHYILIHIVLIFSFDLAYFHFRLWYLEFKFRAWPILSTGRPTLSKLIIKTKQRSWIFVIVFPWGIDFSCTYIALLLTFFILDLTRWNRLKAHMLFNMQGWRLRSCIDSAIIVSFVCWHTLPSFINIPKPLVASSFLNPLSMSLYKHQICYLHQINSKIEYLFDIWSKDFVDSSRHGNEPK